MSAGIQYNAPTGLSGNNPSGLTVDLSWTAATYIGDPYFSNVIALLHMDAYKGSPLATTLYDSSSYASTTWTVETGSVPGVGLTSGAALWGAEGMDCSAGGGTFSGVVQGQLPAVSIGPTTTWTIEGWFNSYSSTADNVLFAYGDWVGGTGFLIVWDAVNQCIYNYPSYFFGGGVPTGANGCIPRNQYNHIALTFESGMCTIFSNGVAIAAPFSVSGSSTSAQAMYVGGSVYGASYIGTFDEVRVTAGVNRYPSNFTPPTGPFPNGTSGSAPPGYDVYRGGVSIATFSGAPGYVDTVPSGGSYTYNVAAWDGVSQDISVESSPFTLTVDQSVVPNVVGDTLATAEAAIVGAGLVVGTVTLATSGSVPAGSIISSSPAGGTVVSLGSSVDLVESEGPVAIYVPNVFNLSLAIATTAIEAAGLTLGLVVPQSDAIIIAGNVDGQSIPAGTEVFAGTSLNLTVSDGLPPLTVPDLFGLTQEDATNLLLSLGLVPGAIGFAPSKIFPANEVMTQNPSAGQLIAPGNIVSFVISTGFPAASNLFDAEQTVISQFANSPTLMQLVQNMNQYIDQSANFAAFYNYVWNVNSAQGFGLDILGRIVGVGRLLQISTTSDYVGFYIASESQPDQDWQPMGSNQPPQPAVGGQMYTGYNATTAYLLPDDAYRQLILAKAFANICATTAPAINQILQNLYGAGSAWVLNTGPMAISYNLSFQPTAIQLAILEQSGVIPTPPGVTVVVNANV